MRRIRGFINPIKEAVYQARRESAAFGQNATLREEAEEANQTSLSQRDSLAESGGVTVLYCLCEYHVCEAAAVAG